jgi:hypothetical protein
MTHQSDGTLGEDPTMKTCWDADHLDLGRVGIKPVAKYLSSVASQHIESAYNWSRQPKGVLGELGLELPLPGRTTQDVDK